MDMLGFDYFKLLDMLTIARSRKHVQRYYGTAETGQFPDRLPPVNIKADVDLAGAFRPIREINNEIRRLTLGAYAPFATCCPISRRPTTRSTARKSGAVIASSARSIAKKASFTCCG